MASNIFINFFHQCVFAKYSLGNCIGYVGAKDLEISPENAVIGKSCSEVVSTHYRRDGGTFENLGGASSSGGMRAPHPG